MRRRRKLMVIDAVALLVLAYVAWAVCVRFGREPVQTNALVGRTELEIRRNYGEPDKDWQGYQDLGPSVARELPSGPIRTLVIYPRGLRHPEGGTLYVWVTAREGEWECFESCWFADGVVF